MKKNEYCKNCKHFGWKIVDGLCINICLIKNKRKNENGWCKEWINKRYTLYIKADKGWEKLEESDRL